jgi:hypothetical protein
MLTTRSGPVVSHRNEFGAREGLCTESAWRQAHEALSRLARERAAAEAEEGRWLLAALRSATHVHLGFGSFGEYVERLFGYKPRSTQEKLRVAEALEQLPVLCAALEAGTMHWSAVRELTRVAVPETEREWLDVARGKTVHQLEALVAGKPRGARPSSPTNADAQRHVLRFEVCGETLCLFREAMSRLQRDSGSSLDEDSALMLMARHVLGGPREQGRASYQIALSICPQCGQGSQEANGELIPVHPEITAMAECDGQHLGLIPIAVRAREHTDPHDGIDCGMSRVHEAARVEFKVDGIHRGEGVEEDLGTPTHARAPTHARVESSAGAHEDGRMGCNGGGSYADVRVAPNAGAHAGAGFVSDGGGTHAGAGVAPNAGAHTDARVASNAGAHTDARVASNAGAHTGVGLELDADADARVASNGSAPRRARAKQQIPPATRRTVLRRDHLRCGVPGCRNARFLDVHHIRLSSEGGSHQVSNLITLCGAHHRAAHRGELRITGSVPDGVRFRHADGSVYGQPLDPRTAEVQAKAFAALRKLGFREDEIRRGLAELGNEQDGQALNLERTFREALARLTSSSKTPHASLKHRRT